MNAKIDAREAIRLYDLGWGYRRIAAQFAVNPSSIKRLLARHGVETRAASPPAASADEDEVEAVAARRRDIAACAAHLADLRRCHRPRHGELRIAPGPARPHPRGSAADTMSLTGSLGAWCAEAAR